MDISAISGSGLQATSNALRASQIRFDAAAERTVADTTADPTGAGSGDLVQDVVGLQSEQMTNAILAAVFRRQSEQQEDLTNLIKPS